MRHPTLVRALPTSSLVHHRLDQPALYRHAQLARLQGVSMVRGPWMDTPAPRLSRRSRSDILDRAHVAATPLPKSL